MHNILFAFIADLTEISIIEENVTDCTSGRTRRAASKRPASRYVDDSEDDSEDENEPTGRDTDFHAVEGMSSKSEYKNQGSIS